MDQEITVPRYRSTQRIAMPVSRRAAVRLLLFLRVQHSRRYFFTLQRNFPRCWSKRHRCDIGMNRKNREHLRFHSDRGAYRAH